MTRWHAQLREGGDDAYRAMLALTRHDPEREQLQRTLLDYTHDPKFGEYAVMCLGYMGRYGDDLLPEVEPRLRELLDDPQLGGAAEETLRDMKLECHPFHLSQAIPPWVISASPGDEEVARQLTAFKAAGGVVVRLDGREMQTERELFRVFARELRFPGYFGHNWDALIDCLKDFHPPWPHPNDLVIVIEHAELLPRLPLFIECMEEAAEYVSFPVDADDEPEPDVPSFGLHVVLETSEPKVRA